MTYKFLFPCQDHNLNEVDESFQNEANICKLLGFQYYTFDFDTFVDDNKFKSNIIQISHSYLIYRGWMLKPIQYERLVNILSEKKQTNLINDFYEYTNFHCFPMIYYVIKDYTPKIIEIKKWEDIYDINIPFDFFLKDHVKSCKNINGVEKISKNIYKDELVDKISAFVKERGKLFTGNIVLKEFVDLKKINDKTNEWRAFYINGNLLTYFQNSYLKTTSHPPLNLIKNVGEKLYRLSNFFTVDFALTEDDKWIVIETGDGQVSGLVKNEELSFYNKINSSILT